MNLEESIDVEMSGNPDSSVGISVEEAAKNYEMAGSRVETDPSEISWGKFKHLYNPETEKMINSVLMDLNIPKLYEFQKIFLHAIGNKKDAFAVVGTGSGKTEATGLASLLLRKVFDEPAGLTVMFVPLTGIIWELFDNEKIPTIAVDIGGQMYGKKNGLRVLLSEDDVLSGDYVRMIMHPESLMNNQVEALMLKLKINQKILGVFIDEFHIMLPRHWQSFRPEMEEQTGRLRVFLRKGAPTGALSATATQEDVSMTIQTLGLKSEPVLLAENPLQSHFKFVMMQRQSDNYGFDGYMDQNSKFHPGLLDQLKLIYIDEYVRCIEEKQEPKPAIIFFRTESQLINLLNYLRQRLNVSSASHAPFVSLVASTPKVTEMVIRSRAGSISLYLSTQKMLMGLNIPGLQICIFVKPMNMIHTVIQGAGRTGRPLPDQIGFRARSLVYILANGGDVGGQVKGMSEEMRRFVNLKDGCLRSYLGSYFLGNSIQAPTLSDWCCSHCSSVFRQQGRTV